MDARKFEEAAFKALMKGSVAVVLSSLFVIVGIVAARGLPAMRWEMITQLPSGGYYLGKGGGILNAIVGTLLLGIGGAALSIAISLPAALCLQKEYVRRSGVAHSARLVFEMLWGIPSIIYGAFGFTVMVMAGMRASLLGGIITLAMVMLPLMARAMDEAIRGVPHGMKEASYAVGATRLQTSAKVVLRQALPGITTAMLLAMGRGMGDAASVLFTAGYTDYLPQSLLDPVASLPLAVFFQLGTPFPEVQQRAYASAFVLLCMVLALSAASRLMTGGFKKYVVR